LREVEKITSNPSESKGENGKQTIGKQNCLNRGTANGKIKIHGVYIG